MSDAQTCTVIIYQYPKLTVKPARKFELCDHLLHNLQRYNRTMSVEAIKWQLLNGHTVYTDACYYRMSPADIGRRT